MTKESILHITNSYGGTNVYYNLYTKLDKLGIQQHVFVPLNSRNRNRKGNQIIDFHTDGSSIYYSTSLKWFHKYIFSFKIRNILESLYTSNIDISKIKLIHASTFCLDGAVAYNLSKKYKIPYVVVVRNTDINTYYKKLKWKRPFFHKILIHASKIIFISPSYQNQLINKILPPNIKSSIKNKVVSIPNGVEDIFLNQRYFKTRISEQINIIYAGGIQKNKNIDSTIKAIDKLRKKNLNITYTIIGESLEYRKTQQEYTNYIYNFANKYNWITILEKQSKKVLVESFRNYDIFVMPSITETFGLVYVEALTQGLPIVYTKGQGFDNFYKQGIVGYAVESKNIDDIADRIEEIIKNYTLITTNINNMDLNCFKWNYIACQYARIYNDVGVK